MEENIQTEDIQTLEDVINVIENLINKYKEQEKEIDVLKALVKENQSTIECYKELLKESKG